MANAPATPTWASSPTSASGQLFRFCELDFPFTLGPADGRYLHRTTGGEEVAVVTFRALHAERRRRLRGRRPLPAEPGSNTPAPVPITRVTVIAAAPFADATAADQWLRDCRGRDEAHAQIEEALELVNRAVAAHRVAAHDPYARDLAVSDIQRARLGYGTGEQIVDGTWRECLTVPDAPAGLRPRRRMLSPDEEMAGMLSGRRPLAQPSEELLVRARLDLNHGRIVEAALVTRAAVEALAAEGHGSEEAETARLAESALAGGLSPAETEELTELVRRLERTVRRRRYADAN